MSESKVKADMQENSAYKQIGLKT